MATAEQFTLVGDIELKEWQKKAVELLEGQGSREILFIVDRFGGGGTTHFCHYLNKFHRVACYSSTAPTTLRRYKLEQIVVFDLQGRHINYSTLIKLKDGLIDDDKWPLHETMGRGFLAPKVVVFTHKFPDKTSMSRDRYMILNI